jgi:hypothetical protein
VATATGACADCHAPGIDGARGARSLLEAVGVAYDAGVHCDVCHHVESVDLTAAGAGIAGRLHIVRPSEPSNNPVFGAFAPLTFGPRPDVANPRMGAVERFHFHDGTLCAGCHEYHQPVLVGAIDTGRWPDGRLPIHTTYSEWRAGALNRVICNACHMPPDPTMGNSADIQADAKAQEGVANGFYRPAGIVKKHSFVGPRTGSSNMLRMAAQVSVQKRMEGDSVIATVRVKNVGAGHAIPTGEPLRALVVTVTAACGDEGQSAVGGDAIPSFAGFLERRTGDFASWPGAQVGQRIRVVRRTGSFRDYAGVEPFGADRSAADKGMPEETVVGEVTVTGADTFSAPIPAGDIAYRVNEQAAAGGPGMAFARVLADAEGQEMVPHFAAADVRSDNRLMPQQSYESTHVFRATCDDPTVTANLWYRRVPRWLDRERAWGIDDILMASETR